MKNNLETSSNNKRKIKTNNLFLMIFLFVGVVPLIVLGSLNLSLMKKSLEQGINNDLMHLSEAKEGQIFAYLDEIESKTLDFSSDVFIKDNLKKINNKEDSNETTNLLNNYLITKKDAVDDFLRGTFIMNSNGKIIASTHNEEMGKDESEDDYFIKGKKGVFATELRGHKHFNLTHPFVVTAPLIDSETGELLGVIANVFEGEKVQEILSGEFQLNKGAITGEKYETKTLDVYLVNRDKEMFIHPNSLKNNKSNPNLGMIVDTWPVKKCLEDNKEITSIYENYLGKEVLGDSQCILNQKWVLLTEIQTNEAFAPVKEMFLDFLLIIVIVFILTIFIALLFARKISRPIRNLANQVNEITKGKLDIQLGKSNIYEQQKLIDSLNRVLASLKLAVLRTGATKEELGLKDIIKAKQEIENKYKVLYETSRDAIMTLEPPTWNFTAANPATIKMFKVKDEKDFTSRAPWEYSPKRQPDGKLSKTKAKEMIMKAMKQGSNFFEWTHKTLTGREFPATVLLTRVELGDKKFLQATVRDISETEKFEEALKADEQKYKGLFEESVAAVYLFDNKKRFIDSNKAGVELLGYTKDELLKMTMSDVDVDALAVVPAHKKLLSGEKIINYKHQLKRKDGKIITVLNNSRPIMDKKGKIIKIQSTLIDISGTEKSSEKPKKIISNNKSLKAIVNRAANSAKSAITKPSSKKDEVLDKIKKASKNKKEKVYFLKDKENKSKEID